MNPLLVYLVKTRGFLCLCSEGHHAESTIVSTVMLSQLLCNQTPGLAPVPVGLSNRFEYTSTKQWVCGRGMSGPSRCGGVSRRLRGLEILVFEASSATSACGLELLVHEALSWWPDVSSVKAQP